MTDWEGFTQALLTRFGPSSYDDLIEALTRLKQVGIVEDYKSRFDAISNRLRFCLSPISSTLFKGLRPRLIP